MKRRRVSLKDIATSVAVALEPATSVPMHVSLVLRKGICVSQLSLAVTSSVAKQLTKKNGFPLISFRGSHP